MLRLKETVAAVALVLIMAAVSFAKDKDKQALPPRSTSGVDHIVVVMMENRSFDHLLGWLPGANGRQEGLTYLDRTNTPQATYPLAPDYQGCVHPDPDHSYQGGRAEYDGGKMDGFLKPDSNDLYAIGYYVEEDRPFFSALAQEYTSFDNYFSPILAGTYPNRIFMHAAQTDRLDNTLQLSTLPTIWDRLIEKGVSARYYFSDVSFLWLWGSKYNGISSSYAQFLADAAAGTLPSVAFVEPRFLGEAEGLSNDDHPHADVRVGDSFLAQTFQAVAEGPAWNKTVFIVTYDEWGGFFEHVPPPRAVAPNNVDPDLVNGKALLGMRIPVVVASPFTHAQSQVNSTLFDNTSILKLIEWRWNLKPLTARDASDDVGNLAFALDFAHPDATVPALPTPDVTPVPCPPLLAAAKPTPMGNLLKLAPAGFVPARR
jgi:phospholipase C